MQFKKINYAELNAKQQERYNFQKVSAILADFGFSTILLSDDWNGADFLACHANGEVLKVQLKGRLTFSKKYLEKDLFICFPSEDNWYIYPHDSFLETVDALKGIRSSASWTGGSETYSFPAIPKDLVNLLDSCRLEGDSLNFELKKAS